MTRPSHGQMVPIPEKGETLYVQSTRRYVLIKVPLIDGAPRVLTRSDSVASLVHFQESNNVAPQEARVYDMVGKRFLTK